MTWTARKIGRILARNTFAGYLCVLPNCTWTGDEIDLLVVTHNRRVIDVEIKISRADLKADKHKRKWWHQPPSEYVRGKYLRPPAVAKPWPRKVWKHYYAMPADIWRDELLAEIQPVSGVLLLRDARNSLDTEHVECRRRAKPCRDVSILSDEHVVQLARLASLRMWDAYAENEARATREVANG